MKGMLHQKNVQVYLYLQNYFEANQRKYLLADFHSSFDK